MATAGVKGKNMDSLFKRDFIQLFEGIDGYTLLAFAILNQAAEDYRAALKTKDVETIEEIEDFLRSEYAETILSGHNWSSLSELKRERYNAWGLKGELKC